MAEIPSRIGVAAVCASALCFSLTPIWVRISEVGPIATGVWRFAIAAPVLWLLLEGRRRGSADLGETLRAGRFGLVVLGGIVFAGNVAFWQLGIVDTVIANASILGNMHPIFVAIGAALFHRERISPTFLIGLVLTIVGAVWLTTARGTPLGEIARGDFFCFMSGLLFAVWVLIIKQLRNEFATPSLVLWNLALSAILLLPLGIWLGESFWPRSLEAWLVLLGFALTANILGQSLFAFGAGRVSASFAALAILLGPIFATFFGWLFLNEGVVLQQFLAGGVVLTGIAFAERGRHRG